MSEKRKEFLWLVQMIMIKHVGVIEGWSGIAGDAVAASHRIPSEMTVRDAALDFCSVFVNGVAGDEPVQVPNWLAELGDSSELAYKG